MWKAVIPLDRQYLFLSAAARSYATAARVSGKQQPGNARKRIAGAATAASLAAALGGAYTAERSGLVTAEEGVPAGAAAAVRFTRALGVSSRIMLDYRILFASHSEYMSDEYKEERSGVHSRSAERLLGLCKTQGGVYVKVGQHIASMNHAVPAEFTSRLVQLEDRAAFRSYSHVERVICKELGGTVADHFESFEREPLAAASLAQVHRATLKGSGDVVACKVQHAGLVTQVAGDLVSIRVLSRLLSIVFPGTSLDWIVDQFQENLKKELDFSLEAVSSERTRKFFEELGSKQVSVPKIYFPQSAGRVLTMEFIDGFRVDDFDRLDAAGIRREDVASAVVDAFGKMIFVSGNCQCDGHGGNMLVRPRANGARGQFDLVLLDHGLYCELDDNFRRAYCRLWRGLVLRHSNEVNKACEDLGTPGLGNMFSIFLLNRSWSSAQAAGVDLRNKMSKEEFKELMRELRDGGVQNGADAVSMLGDLPPDLLLVFKMNTLVRNINKALGAPVDRFRSNVRNAVRGLHHINPEGLQTRNPSLSESAHDQSGRLSGGHRSFRLLHWLKWKVWEPIACWTDIAYLELNLFALDLMLATYRWWNGLANLSSGASDKLLG